MADPYCRHNNDDNNKEDEGRESSQAHINSIQKNQKGASPTMNLDKGVAHYFIMMAYAAGPDKYSKNKQKTSL